MTYAPPQPGRAVRFCNGEFFDDPNRIIYDGFHAGMNLGGNDVWVTAETFLRNMYDDLRMSQDAEGFPDRDMSEVWAQTLLYAVNESIDGPEGRLYLLADCNLHYEDES